MTIHKSISSKHQAFYPKPVPEAITLWRIMSIDKLQTILCNKGMWFSRLDQFDDPKEGKLPHGNLGLLVKYPLYARNWTLKEYGLTVQRSYACCLHMNTSNPPAHLWKTFGGPTPVAITTTVKRICNQIPSIATKCGPIYMGQVDYIDHCKDTIQDGNVIYPAYAVQTSYVEEREARLLIHTCGTVSYETLYGKFGPFGPLMADVPAKQSFSGQTEIVGAHNDGKAIVLQIEPKSLIETIVSGPGLADNIWQNISTIAKTLGIDDKLRE